MADKRFFKPALGLLVADPITHQVLAAEGAWVELSPYWLRRLAEGDVVEAKAPAASKTKNSEVKQ